MNSRFLHRYQLHLTPISPVHLGTGLDYEPTNYVIDNNHMFVFDPSTANLSAAAREELLVVAKRADLLGIQQFFKKHKDSFIACAHHIANVSAGVAQEYEKKIGQVVNAYGTNNVLNRFNIEASAFNPSDYRPYIPGSAFKGALRTTVLNKINDGARPISREPGRTPKPAEFEKRLLKGDFESSPFRLLKTADFMPVNEVATQVMYATNHKKKEVILKNGTVARGGGLTARRECILPGQYRAFSADCVIHDLLDAYAAQMPDSDLSPKILQEWAKQNNAYYAGRFVRELQVLLSRKLISDQWFRNMGHLIQGLQQDLSSGNIMLMRLGKNTGAESKTLDKIAKIKINKGKGKSPAYESETYTFWLAADTEGQLQNLLPFGWVIVEISPERENQNLKKWCQNYEAELKALHGLKQKVILQRAETQEAKKQALQERMRIEQERIRREMAEQAAQEDKAAQLAAMSEAKRVVTLLLDRLDAIVKKQSIGNGTIFNEIIETYNLALSKWTAEEQKWLASQLNVKKLESKFESLGKKEKEVKALLRQLRGEA